MSGVPINPTGFAHGFRPLEGDFPPPTPTQRDAVSDGRSNGCSRAMEDGVLSVTQPSQREFVGAMGGGSGGARKRRRLPGPLAFLQQAGAGAASSTGGDAGVSDGEGDTGSNSRNADDEGEVCGGHFSKGPWLTLCSATDAPVPEEGVSAARAVQAFLLGTVSPMSEVLDGDFDLRVPVVTAVVDSLTKLSPIDIAVELVDPSGRMKGYFHPDVVEEHGPDLAPGAALLLKEVSIFVSGPGTTRLLNIHPDCVITVFPPDTPMPTPARLDWLRTCDPPFTPRPLADSSDASNTRQGRRSSPPTTPMSSTCETSRRRRRRPRSPEDRQQSQRTPPARHQSPQTPRGVPEVALGEAVDVGPALEESTITSTPSNSSHRNNVTVYAGEQRGVTVPAVRDGDRARLGSSGAPPGSGDAVADKLSMSASSCGEVPPLPTSPRSRPSPAPDEVSIADRLLLSPSPANSTALSSYQTQTQVALGQISPVVRADGTGRLPRRGADGKRVALLPKRDVGGFESLGGTSGREARAKGVGEEPQGKSEEAPLGGIGAHCGSIRPLSSVTDSRHRVRDSEDSTVARFSSTLGLGEHQTPTVTTVSNTAARHRSSAPVTTSPLGTSSGGGESASRRGAGESGDGTGQVARPGVSRPSVWTDFDGLPSDDSADDSASPVSGKRSATVVASIPSRGSTLPGGVDNRDRGALAERSGNPNGAAGECGGRATSSGIDRSEESARPTHSMPGGDSISNMGRREYNGDVGKTRASSASLASLAAGGDVEGRDDDATGQDRPASAGVGSGALSPRACSASAGGGGTFTLMGARGGFEDDDLLDAALDESD